MGTVKFGFEISNEKFYKQAKACARTEDGVVNMTSDYANYRPTKSKNKIIEKIWENRVKVSNKNIELNNTSFENYVTCKNIKKEMIEIFKGIEKDLIIDNEDYVVINTK